VEALESTVESGRPAANGNLQRGRPADLGLRLLSVYKLALGLLLFAVALQLLWWVDRELHQELHGWVVRLHADPESPWIAAMLERAAALPDSRLALFAAVSSLFGLVHFVEGLGLWWRRRWAEWLCLVATGLLIPVEIFEIAARPDGLKVLILLVNLAVVGYLGWRVAARRGAAGAALGGFRDTPSGA